MTVDAFPRDRDLLRTFATPAVHISTMSAHMDRRRALTIAWAVSAGLYLSVLVWFVEAIARPEMFSKTYKLKLVYNGRQPVG